MAIYVTMETWSSYLCPNNMNMYTLEHLNLDNVNLTSLTPVLFVFNVYMYVHVSTSVVTP